MAAEGGRTTDGNVRIGVAAGDNASVIWQLLCGMAKAKYCRLTCDVRDGKEAERIGLVSRVVEGDRLLEAALDLAEQINGYSTLGVAMTKKLLWSSLEIGSLEAAIELENRDQLLVRMLTKNLDEAVRARRENRPPVFED